MRITLKLDGISVGRSEAVRFDDILQIETERADKVTYDEAFLILIGRSGELVTLGELDEGFAEAERELRSRLPGFRDDWQDSLESAPVGTRFSVWPAS